MYVKIPNGARDVNLRELYERQRGEPQQGGEVRVVIEPGAIVSASAGPAVATAAHRKRRRAR